MNFISETKFNAPIKGCLPSTQGNDKGDLRIDSNLQLLGDLCEDGSFSVTGGIRVGGGSGNGGVTIGNFKGCGSGCNASGMVQGSFAEFNHGNFQELNICNAALFNVCSFNEFAVYDEIRFTQQGLYGTCYWTFCQARCAGAGRGFMIKGGKGDGSKSGGRMSIDSDGAGVFIDDLHIGLDDGCAQDGITLKNEKITSWSDLKKYVGGGTEANNKIQRFTSPALPANCSMFYFEGDETVTGTELPFIQVRETASGKLFQMDVWVNLDEACGAFTLGKPVAEVEPCTSAIEAGKWTAIVMN